MKTGNCLAYFAVVSECALFYTEAWRGHAKKNFCKSCARVSKSWERLTNSCERDISRSHELLTRAHDLQKFFFACPLQASVVRPYICCWLSLTRVLTSNVSTVLVCTVTLLSVMLNTCRLFTIFFSTNTGLQSVRTSIWLTRTLQLLQVGYIEVKYKGKRNWNLWTCK